MDSGQAPAIAHIIIYHIGAKRECLWLRSVSKEREHLADVSLYLHAINTLVQVTLPACHLSGSVVRSAAAP